MRFEWSWVVVVKRAGYQVVEKDFVRKLNISVQNVAFPESAVRNEMCFGFSSLIQPYQPVRWWPFDQQVSNARCRSGRGLSNLAKDTDML